MTNKLRPASSFSAFAQEAARAACVEFLLFAPVIKRRALGAPALEELLLDEEEPDYTPDPEPMPAKTPRAMLAPTRSQVENGYITGQPTVKRTTKPGPKAEPKTSRRYRGAGQGRWKGPRK